MNKLKVKSKQKIEIMPFCDDTTKKNKRYYPYCFSNNNNNFTNFSRS